MTAQMRDVRIEKSAQLVLDPPEGGSGGFWP
jgi:hypothetical protein